MKKKKLVRWGASVVAAAFLVIIAGPLMPLISAHASGGPTLTITAPVTIPGANVTLSGAGFNAGEVVHVGFGAQSSDVTADGSGNISGVQLPIPNVPAGLQFASGFGETSGHWALAYLWVAGFAPAVSPSTWYVLPGQSLTFTGTGFAPTESVQLMYGATVLGSTTTNGSGGFSMAGVSLPVSLHNTLATLTFKGGTSNVPVPLTLTVGQLSPSITPSLWYTAPGSVVSISGSGFAPNEPVTVTGGTHPASVSANASGSFTVGSYALPATSGAGVTLTATGAASDAQANASITLSSLSPWLTFSTYWAQGGAALTVFGNGFAGGEAITLSSGTQTLGTTTAGGGGAFSFAGAVPFAPAGPVTITATGVASGAVGTGSMQVAPVYTSLTLGSYAVTRGHTLEIIGSGYLPGEPVQITTSNTGTSVVLTIPADAGGSFDNTSYVVPATTTPGNMTVTAFGTHSFDTKSVTLYIGQ